MNNYKARIINHRQRKQPKNAINRLTIAALTSTPTSALVKRTLNPSGSEVLVSSVNCREGDDATETNEAREVEDIEGDNETDLEEGILRISGISVITTDLIPAGVKGESNLGQLDRTISPFFFGTPHERQYLIYIYQTPDTVPSFNGY